MSVVDGEGWAVPTSLNRGRKWGFAFGHFWMLRQKSCFGWRQFAPVSLQYRDIEMRAPCRSYHRMAGPHGWHPGWCRLGRAGQYSLLYFNIGRPCTAGCLSRWEGPWNTRKQTCVGLQQQGAWFTRRGNAQHSSRHSDHLPPRWKLRVNCCPGGPDTKV